MDKERKRIIKAWILVLQLGLASLSPVILCVALGYLVRLWCKRDLLLLFVLLGIISGALSAWRMAKSQAGEDDEETKLISGIYDRCTFDRAEDMDTETEEDLLLEEYRRNNEQREKKG